MKDVADALAAVSRGIEAAREEGRKEGMAAVAGPVLGLAENTLRGPVDSRDASASIVWASDICADIYAAIPAEASTALRKVQVDAKVQLLTELIDDLTGHREWDRIRNWLIQHRSVYKVLVKEGWMEGHIRGCRFDTGHSGACEAESE